jgi:fibronectin-binding autotransporter adhesin
VTIGSAVTVGSNTVALANTGTFSSTNTIIPQTGLFTVQNGTAVTVNGGMKVGENTGALVGVGNSFTVDGQVKVTGGSLTVNGALTLGTATAGDSASTTANVVGGSLSVSGGTVNVTGGMTLATNNTSTFTRPNNVTGSVAVSGGSLTVGGDIVPGATGGPGTVTSTLSLTGGLMDMQGHNVGALSTVTFSGGTLRNAGTVSTAVTQTGGILEQTGTGTTTVVGNYNLTNGTARVTNAGGTLAFPGQATVGAAGTLSGVGTVTGPVTVASGGTVSPGNSPGTLSFGNGLTINGNYLWELATAGTPADPNANPGGSTPAGPQTNHDALAVSGGLLDLTGSTLNLTSLGSTGFNNAQPYSWQIATAPSGVIGTPTIGTISGADFGNLNGGTFTVVPTANSVLLNFTPSPVPEPAFVLLACGAAAGGLGWWKRRRSASA